MTVLGIIRWPVRFCLLAGFSGKTTQIETTSPHPHPVLLTWHAPQYVVGGSGDSADSSNLKPVPNPLPPREVGGTWHSHREITSI